MKNRGFTLIEVLITLLIMSFFLLVSVPMFSKIAESTKLKTSARSVTSVLRTARGYAISEYTPHYVFFDITTTHKYYISNEDDGDPVIDKIYALPVGVEFSNITDFTEVTEDVLYSVGFKTTGELRETADPSIDVKDTSENLINIDIERTTGRTRIE